MVGPKLNARSYAILILAALTLALGGKLIAQESGAGSQYQASAEVAAATRDVAAATREVAASNNAIAEAIRQLAASVDNAGKAKGATTESSAPASDAQSGGIQPVSAPANDAAAPAAAGSKSDKSGVFEMDKK